MHPNVRHAPRRVHSAEFKAKVMAQCREPGASVAAVAMAHDVNANVVRKWLAGHGLKRAARVIQGGTLTPSPAKGDGGGGSLQPACGAMRFLPVGIAAASIPDPSMVTPGASNAMAAEPPCIHVELRRGNASVVVRWPTSQAQGCAAWLNELAGAVLQG
jgi:transposase